MCVVLDVGRVEHVGQGLFDGAFRAEFDSISLDYPEKRCQHLVHPLSVPNARVHLAPYKKYIQHHVLCRRLAEVDIVWHTPLDVLENLSTKAFIGSQG